MSKLFLSILITFTILVNLQSQSLWNGQGHIPQAYQLEWTTAGLLANTPKTADHVYIVTDPVFDDSDNSNYDGEINNAIDSAKNDGGVSIIYFPSGDYNLNSMIELDETYNNIIFQGAGSEETTLIFAVGSGNYCFDIQGDIDESDHIDVQYTLAKDQVNVTGDKSFSTYYDSDKWIWLRQNDYVGHGDDRWADYSVGQINKIVSYSGNNATLAYKASKDYSSSNDIYIYNIDPVMNIGIENLKIYRNESGSSSSGSNIFFKYAVNCWVKGVESSNTCRHHVDAQQSSHIYVSGCYLHHANDYGGYGRGYGVVLNISTTNCLVENNIFKTLRHAMTVQAGANCNVFTYNYSRDQEWTNGFWADLLGDDGPDICIHGNYSYGNLFEHNMVELIVADDPHGANGPYNAFVRNYSKDSDGVFHYMILYNAPYSSVLGCELRCDELYQPIMQSGTTNLVTDLWGKVATSDPDHNTYETAFWHTHESLARNLGIWDYGVLLDNSYYYSSIPTFVDEYNISFPSIGPPVYYVSQNIPAKNRYSNPPETYLLFDEQTHAPVYILQGSDVIGLYSSLNSALADVISGQTIAVYKSQDLTNDTTIPSGVTLEIDTDANINLNGYHIRCSGSGIIEKYGSVSGYASYAKYGNNYKGFFPTSVSIAQILSWSLSGWNVHILAGTYPQNDHLLVSSDRTLTLHSGVNINFSGSYKLDVYGSLNCEGSSGSDVTINGQNYSRSSYSNSMVDIKSGASADIEYTNFINSPYHLIIRNSADAEISHSTFSNFGFSTSSRAVTIYYSAGDVSIHNCTFTGSGSKGIGVYSNNTGTNVTIADNTFSNCRYAIRCYSSDALISGNTITSYYYYYGIYSDNVSYDAKYWENEITGNFSSYGVYLNSSTPYFFKNTLNQSKMLINSCSPNFYDPTGPVCLKGYNTIHNAGAPLIKVQNYSTPYLGYGLEESGYNSMYETDLPHMWITNYSGSYADNNYWGQEGPANYADGTSWFLDRWPLSFNPNLNKLGESSFEDFSIREDEKEDEEEFMAALDAGFKLDYVKAKERLNNLIYRETTSRFPALSVLMYDYFTKRELQDAKSSRDENLVQNELTVLVDDLCKKEVSDPLRPFGLKLNARESSLNKDYNSLSNFNSQIIAEYPNSIHEMTSLFDEISYQVEVKEDFAKAKELLLRMDKAYPDENLTLMAHVVLGENVDLYDSKLPKVAESKEALYIPASFKMHLAFPNPFNPATTIKYELPKDVHVKLSVYNINGQKILDLVKGYQVAGVHEIVFNGSNLSSGMYFYMISAGDFSDVKRLLLIK